VALALDTGALDRHRAICERTGADACLVVYRVQIVQEWYGPGYTLPIEAMSSTFDGRQLISDMRQKRP
jgi:hypothetical protein